MQSRKEKLLQPFHSSKGKDFTKTMP